MYTKCHTIHVPHFWQIHHGWWSSSYFEQSGWDEYQTNRCVLATIIMSVVVFFFYSHCRWHCEWVHRVQPESAHSSCQGAPSARRCRYGDHHHRFIWAIHIQWCSNGKLHSSDCHPIQWEDSGGFLNKTTPPLDCLYETTKNKFQTVHINKCNTLLMLAGHAHVETRNQPHVTIYVFLKGLTECLCLSFPQSTPFSRSQHTTTTTSRGCRVQYW